MWTLGFLLLPLWAQTSGPGQTQAPAPPRKQLESKPQQMTKPLEFELNGLRYQTLTRYGVTVMFAQTPSLVRNYNIMQVTIANGSDKPIEIKPGDFSFHEADGSRRVRPMPPREVVDEFMARASREDVIRLVQAYEQTLYGMNRVSPTSGYERRRQAMAAEFVNLKLRAAATASAIVLVGTKLAPGESTDGALFFPTQGRPIGAGKLQVSTATLQFEFDTYANPSNPNVIQK